jgi:broad specificity phosphatase PhoE
MNVGSDRSTRISFVRHGRVHNPEKIVYGRLPGFRLSEQGRREADAAAARLQTDPVDALFTSPMLRARQTARAVALRQGGVDTHVSRLIIEVCSPFQGRPSAAADQVRWDLYSGAGCDFEQPPDIVDRVLRFVSRCLRRYPGGHVAAVTHGDVVAFTLLWAIGASLRADHRLDMREHGFPDRYPATGSITTLSFPADGPRPPVDIAYWKPSGIGDV